MEFVPLMSKVNIGDGLHYSKDNLEKEYLVVNL